MSKEFDKGLLVGRSSLLVLHNALKKSLGEWSRILPYLDQFSSKEELELVASINYVLGGDEIKLTPPLKASLAVDFVNSEKKLLISDQELLLAGGGYGEKEE